MRTEVRTGPLGPFPHVSRPVFSISAGLIVAFVLFGILFPEAAGALFPGLQAQIGERFGWLLTLTTTSAIGFVLYAAMSRYGDIRLGAQTEEPQYGFFSWVSMLFSAGIGIGLLYWGVAEPLQHFAEPPVGEPFSVEAAQQAMVLSFLHWGIHGWAIYALVGLSLAYFHFRHGLPLSIRSALYPLIGERIYGPIGHAVDILAVFGTIFGVVTSLGLGVMQISDGLEVLTGIEGSIALQLGLLAGITAAATLSVMAGLNSGIKRLSNFNVGLSMALLAFVVVFGPTLYVLDSFIENIGLYLEALPRLSFWNESYSGTDWQVDWTIFYWTWWISWSPFVGIFIARISRGRTVREFSLGVLCIPCGILFFWFTAFGGVAVQMELSGAEPGLAAAAQASYGSAIFAMMEFYPFTTLLNALIVVMIVIWFVTSADSASLVVDMLTAGGHDDPPRIQRMFWAISSGAIAAVLVVAGGLESLQAAAVVAGFPFTFVILVMMFGLLRGFGRDRLVLHRTKQWYLTEKEADHNLPDAYEGEKHLKGPPAVVSGD